MKDIKIATEQVEAFIEILSSKYGINEEEIPKLINAVKWAAEHKVTIDKLSMATLVAIITTFVGGVVITIWESIKTYIGKV